MENQTKKYVIKDLYSDREIHYFISDSTTSLEDIWTSGYFKDKDRNKNQEDYNKPKIFTDIKEAKRYLKEAKRLSNVDWKENGYIHKQYGKSKPQWDIYDYIESKIQNENN